ncbi:MAG: hypothetical protein KF855_09280 [Acidobacteria bacterium]|nr:hypothetical protein [Acidobacteriota bacterium]
MLNWLKQFKAEKNTPADTRPLKRGEIKGVLISLAEKEMPGFEFLDYRNTFYNFQRIRNLGKYSVSELFHIGFSLKGRAFSCSVASRLNPNLIHDRWYNVGLLNPHRDIITIKKRTGIIPIEEAYYYHNGMLETCVNTANQIFTDLKKYGLPFFEEQYRQMLQNPTIQVGFRYLENLNEKEVLELKQAINEDLKTGKGLLFAHPLCIDLKRTLQAVRGESREFRKCLPGAALEFLRFYCAVYEGAESKTL